MKHLFRKFWAVSFLLALITYDSVFYNSSAAQGYGGYWTSKSSTAASVSSTAFPLLAPDSLCAAPTYSWTSEPTLGLARIIAGAVSFCSGGAERWRFSAVSAGGAIDVIDSSGNGYIGFGGVIGSADAKFHRDAAGALAQRNGTNTQTFRLYNTFTDASNYERLSVNGQAASAFEIGVENAGTGAARALNIGTRGNATLGLFSTNTVRWQVSGAGNFLAAADNTYNIGSAASARPATIFAATTVIAPNYQSSTSKFQVVGASGNGPTQVAPTQTTPPTCTTNCGTSPAVAGSDTAGTVTMGSSGVPATGWVVTFNGTWATAPACTVQMALSGMVSGKLPLTVVTTTTTFTVQTNGTAPSVSDKYHYICLGLS
jgi:hypothetical protein